MCYQCSFVCHHMQAVAESVAPVEAESVNNGREQTPLDERRELAWAYAPTDVKLGPLVVNSLDFTDLTEADEVNFLMALPQVDLLPLLAGLHPHLPSLEYCLLEVSLFPSSLSWWGSTPSTSTWWGSTLSPGLPNGLKMLWCFVLMELERHMNEAIMQIR